MDKHLHIVCLDVPYPADYGGVFDLFYKIAALHKQGVKIHLHCFEYGRGEQNELNKYCVEVNYYKRRQGLQSFSFSLPYIVNSRSDKNLLLNLQKDDHPILLEGIHCTYFLYKNELQNRKVFVRLHNVEFEYYKQLAKSSTSIFKKNYYLLESNLLKKYEKNIAHKAVFITVSQKDEETYKQEFNATRIEYLPVFLPFTKVTCQEGKGNFCLYHGNLSVAENEKAATWLAQNIFDDLQIPFLIAGRNPSKKLKSLTLKSDNISIVENPSEQEINKLISNAQMNVLPSFNSTGIKIKILHALFTGKFCLVNEEAVTGSGIESACIIATNAKSFKQNIIDLYQQTFTQNEIELRKQILQSKFNNEENAKQLMQWIY